MANLTSPILDTSGRPFSKVNGRSVTLPRTIKAGYDAAGSQVEHQRYWANADCLSADAANSPTVRQKLRNRSRYEFANNGFVTGIVSAHVAHMIGVGPQLRALTNSPAFNQAIELVFSQWAAEVRLGQKLATLARAKVVDGEGFAVVVANEGLRHPVKVALVLIEAEQVTSPYLSLKANEVDGVLLDKFGNPAIYYVLPYHPGGNSYVTASNPLPVPAEYVLHWFDETRPGQHRGVPALTAVLNVGASSRRFREATVAAAESAALLGAAMLHTQGAPEETAPLTPFDTLAIERGTMTALPAGWSIEQLDPSHPSTTYDSFIRQQVTELCRPLNMPVTVALGDSSQSSFSSARLDSLQWYGRLTAERQDCNSRVLDRLFQDHFWPEAVRAYGWAADPSLPPTVEFLWPQFPVIDPAAQASAAVARMQSGLSYPSAEFAEQGRDFEDELPKIAADYGVTPEEMRARLLEVNLPGAAPAPTDQQTFQQAAAAWIAAGGPK